MKKIAFMAAVLFAFSAQAQQQSEVRSASYQEPKIQGTLYGKSFDETNSMTVDEVINRAAVREISNIAVRGKIAEVCQAEGCWMRVVRSNGSTMLVKFIDHSFVIPKDLAGKEVSFFGRCYQTTLSVDMLRHYAEDAGKSKAEIEKITEPSKEFTFEATGAIIK